MATQHFHLTQCCQNLFTKIQDVRLQYPNTLAPKNSIRLKADILVLVYTFAWLFLHPVYKPSGPELAEYEKSKDLVDEIQIQIIRVKNPSKLDKIQDFGSTANQSPRTFSSANFQSRQLINHCMPFLMKYSGPGRQAHVVLMGRRTTHRNRQAHVYTYQPSRFPRFLPFDPGLQISDYQIIQLLLVIHLNSIL